MTYFLFNDVEQKKSNNERFRRVLALHHCHLVAPPSWTTSGQPSLRHPRKSLLSLIEKTWHKSRWILFLLSFFEVKSNIYIQISGYQPRKMPMKPPRPLASSPTSSDKNEPRENIASTKKSLQETFCVTCIELRLVDIAAGLDIEVKSWRPVSSPVCFLRGFLNKSERPAIGKRKLGSG